MGRKRKHDKDLPARWTRRRGKIYYQVPPGREDEFEGRKMYPLGFNESEAFKKWSEIVKPNLNMGTMAKVFDRYLIEVVTDKAKSTQEQNRRSIKLLTQVFGEMRPRDVKPSHIYKYKDIRSQKAPISANRDLEVLSHVFTKCIQWGAIERHPMVNKGVVHNPEKPRNRYVEDWELSEFLLTCGDFLQRYIRLKLMLGLRKGDMLRIKHSDLKEDGIHVTPNKTQGTTGKKVIYEWSPALKSIVNEIKTAGNVKAFTLFATRAGKPYIDQSNKTSGFDSVWQRAMKRAIDQTKLESRFTEHDLRAKVASDTDIDRAQQLMGHSDARITERVYRRKAEIISADIVRDLK